MSLSGRKALVTGASRGIGADIARALGAAGAAVAVTARSEEVTDPRLPGTIHTVAQEIRDGGGEAVGVRIDVRDPESIAAGVKQAAETLGGLDIIVNNAAVLVPGTLETVQSRHLDLLWQIAGRGPILVAKEALPHLKDAEKADIINVSSRAGVFPGPGPYENPRSGGGFYAMIKAGLERYTQALAMELQADNIAVNVLSPQGLIYTPGAKFAQNDPENPDLEFQPAEYMAKGSVWLCEQPPTFTGHILFDEDLCREQGL